MIRMAAYRNKFRIPKEKMKAETVSAASKGGGLRGGGLGGYGRHNRESPDDDPLVSPNGFHKIIIL